MGAKQAKALAGILTKLEAEYGTIQPTDDPVEAGFLALLAEHAPEFSTDAVRDHLRMAFVNWNEMRVAEPWDIVVAMGAGGKAPARKFAKTAGKYMRSLHSVLNRCAFDNVDPEVDPATLVAKMRGVPATSKLVVLSLVKGGAAPNQDMSKFLQKQGIIPKTTSVNKAAKSLIAVCPAEDLLRAHYLLGRYLSRGKDAYDPLDPKSVRKEPAKAAARTPKKAPTTATTAAKKVSKATKSSTKKAAVKKVATKKPAKKATAKKTATKTASTTARKPAKKAVARKPAKKTSARKPAKATAKKTARKPAKKTTRKRSK